jgi:hypothetical protein
MASDYTIILSQRQHFGDQPRTFDDVEPDVKFVGPTKDFPFSCPNVNPNETAVLMFQTREISISQRNVFRVNGFDVFGAHPAKGNLPASGGLPASPSKNEWNGNVMLLEAEHMKPNQRLKPTGNILHIEARNDNGGGGGNIDDFIIDNVVIMYKSR